MRENYDAYRFSRKEWIGYLFAGVTGYGVLCLLLYDSFWPLVCLPGALPAYLRLVRKGCREKRKRRLQEMFIPAAEAFVVALRAGYSAETALKESRRDMQRLAGEREWLVREFIYMEKQMSVSVPLEKLFLDLAVRSGVEDIAQFAQVFAAGKRTGGDLDGILTRTVRHMKQKQETQKDIEAEVASRRMEQNIMSMVPFGILLYLRLSSPEYMEVLYETMAGRAAMTVCLGLYLVSWLWGRRITALEV